MILRRHAAALIALGMAGCTVEAPPPVTAEASAPDEAPKPVVPVQQVTPAQNGDAPPPLLAERPSKVDVDDLLLRANRAAESGKLPSAMRIFEEVLLAEPDNRHALATLGKTAQRYAMSIGRPASSPLYLKSAEAFRKLLKVDPNLSDEEKGMMAVAEYNAACTLAIAGDSAGAMAALVDAFEAGFSRIDLIDTDLELEGLRRLPTFQAFQVKVEEQHVQNLLATTPPFSFDFILPGLDGKPQSLSALRGAVTIVDIWGTWCVPCRKEVPHLVELAKEYAGMGLKVVGINYEKEEGDEARDAVRAFLKEYGVEYPCVLGDQATLERVPNFGGYPTTLLLDREGTVRLILSGYHSKLALELSVKALLEDSATTKAPAPRTEE